MTIDEAMLKSEIKVCVMITPEITDKVGDRLLSIRFEFDGQE